MQPPQPTPFNIEQYLREQKAKVDARLDELLPKADVYPAVIHEAMRYSVFAGGKRLRGETFINAPYENYKKNR